MSLVFFPPQVVVIYSKIQQLKLRNSQKMLNLLEIFQKLEITILLCNPQIVNNE